MHDTLSVFPLTGASPSTGTALNTASSGVPILPFITPIGPSANFDVAFDLDGQRRVIIYPVSQIVQPLTGATEVGLLKVAGSFESLDRAPTGPYETGEAVVAAVGEVVAIQAKRNRSGEVCSFAISPSIFSKLVVDSVSTGSNQIWFRIVVNPNCGFRSFAPGVPRN